MDWKAFVADNKQAITNRNRVLQGIRLSRTGSAFAQMAMDL